MKGFKLNFKEQQIFGGIEDGITSLLISNKDRLYIHFGSLTSNGITFFTWYSADLHIGDTFTIQFLNITKTTVPQDTITNNLAKRRSEIELDLYRRLKQELTGGDSFPSKDKPCKEGLNIYYNKKKLEVAIEDDGMIFFNLSSHYTGDRMDIRGINYIKHERYIWRSSSLMLGDKIKIEIAEIDKPSTPIEITKDEMIIPSETKQAVFKELEKKLKRKGLI
jgi:sRNA-binding carbon storage regulator CsrA